jgi:hypothetical protein
MKKSVKSNRVVFVGSGDLYSPVAFVIEMTAGQSGLGMFAAGLGLLEQEQKGCRSTRLAESSCDVAFEEVAIIT